MSPDIDPGPRLRAGLHSVSAPPGDIGRVVKRANALQLRRRVAVASIAVVVITGIALPLGLHGGIVSRDRPVPIGPRPPIAVQGYAPPTFADAPGWHVLTSGTTPFGSQDVPIAWAANVPFAPEDLAGVEANGWPMAFPAETMRSMPPNGIVIVASLRITPGTIGNTNFGPRSLPLGLADAQIRLHWETQPAPNVPEYLLHARVDRRYVDVDVYFGTRHPEGTLLATAQAELDRLIIPAFRSGPSPAATWVTHRVGTLTLETPSTWTFRWTPVPSLLGPKYWLAAGNWRFPAELGGTCAQQPAVFRSFPPNGAVFWIFEYPYVKRERSTYLRQPATFSLVGHRPIHNSCARGWPEYELRFRSHGRFFQVQIAFGQDASPAVRAEVLRSLSSFRAGSGAG